MSWAEFKKINSNFNKPVNELINEIFKDNEEQLNLILSQSNDINILTNKVKQYLMTILDSKDTTETIFNMINKINIEKNNIKQSLTNIGISMNDIPFLSYHNKINNIELKKPEQSKIVTPTYSKITVMPDKGKTLSSVIINPAPQKGMLRTAEFSSSKNPFGVRVSKKNLYDVDWQRDMNISKDILDNAFAMHFKVAYFTSKNEYNSASNIVYGWWVKYCYDFCESFKYKDKNGNEVTTANSDLDIYSSCYINNYNMRYHKNLHENYVWVEKPTLKIIYSDYS